MVKKTKKDRREKIDSTPPPQLADNFDTNQSIEKGYYSKENSHRAFMKKGKNTGSELDNYGSLSSADLHIGSQDTGSKPL